MSFDWNRFLTFAEANQHSTDEECLRAAVSRAYYAAYNTARARLLKDGITVPNTVNTHLYVWWYFDAIILKADVSVMVQKHGQNLKKLRVKADYDDIPPINSNNAQKAIEMAHEIIDTVAGIGQPLQLRTKAAFDAYSNRIKKRSS